MASPHEAESIVNYDYYSLLGIAPSADQEAVKKAYRKRALECHPDRGGSHDTMVLVNEAWVVLSDPESRARYDEARYHIGDRVAQEAAAADAQKARQRAEEYPRQWADFDRWLNQVAGDFSSARHGSTPLFWDIPFPTVDNSYSGFAFIVIGLILGAAVAIATLHNPKMKDSDRQMAFLGFIGGVGGAWVGAWLHRGVAEAIKESRESAAPSGPNEKHRQKEESHAGPDGASASRILVCEKCSQKLRVPGGEPELLVTCRSCGHKFSCPPG